MTPSRWLLWLEIAFLATFFWQTRLPLSLINPQWGPTSAAADYFIPYLYLNDLLFVLVLLSWLFLYRPWQQWRLTQPFWSQVWCWVGLFLLVTAISTALGQTGLSGWWRWGKVVEAALVGWWVVNRWGDRHRVQLYAIALLGGLLWQSILMVVEVMKQGSWGWQWLGEWRFSLSTPGIAKANLFGHEVLRGYGTFAHPNIAAAMLALGLGWWGIGYPPTWPSVGKWIGWGMLASGLLVSFSRAGWLAALFLLGWYLAYYWRQGLTFHRRWLVIAGISILISLPLVAERVISLWQTDQQSYLIRNYLWQRAWLIWRDYPWWGVGLQGFILHSLEYGPLSSGGYLRQPVHVVPLLILVETGLIGATVGVAVVTTATISLWQSLWRQGRQANIVTWMLAGSWLAVIGLSLVDHYWWTSQPGLLAIGALLGASRVGYAKFQTSTAK